MKSTGFTQSPTINSIDNTPIFEEYKYATNTNTTISVKPFSTGFIAVQFGPTELPTCVLRKKSDNNINEVKDIISQIVYPNPANSILNIDIKDDLLDSDFLLFSIDGRNVYSQKLSQNHQEIDIQKFAKGIYVYKITKNGISIDGKLVFSE
jgi:hypothetical protein